MRRAVMCFLRIAREREREKRKKKKEKENKKNTYTKPLTHCLRIYCTVGVGNRFAARDPVDARVR